MRKDVTPHYEGADVLATLLEAAGCTLSVTDVEYEFEASIEEDADTPPGDVIPLLFDQEPRFSDADEAGRLYANLLGLWTWLRNRALGVLPVVVDGPPPPPEEGGAPGPEVPASYVAWAWQDLMDASEKEQQRIEDRFENRQGLLMDWVRSELGAASPQAEEIAVGLCVFTWQAFLRAFGASRVGAVTMKSLTMPPEAESQPTLAAYHRDMLDDAVEMAEEPLPEPDRPVVDRVLDAVRRGLTEASRPL